MLPFKSWVVSNFKKPQTSLIIGVVLILYACSLWIQNPFVGDILASVFMFASLSLAWNILGGYTGQFSLGHAGFFGIGAYTSTVLLTNFGLNPWLGMIFGGILAALVGGIVFYPCFRLTGIFFCLASLAFTEVMRILFLHFRGLTQGAMGITIPFEQGLAHMMFRDKNGYMLLGLTFMIVIALISRKLEKSRFGYKMIAVRENEETTETLGISSSRTKLIAIMISAFFTGCMGTFYAQFTLLIDPDSVFSVMMSVEFALLAILGGIGTVLGPIIGAFILIPIDTLMRGYLGQGQQGLSLIAYGTLLVIVVLFIPQGILPWLKSLSTKKAKSDDSRFGERQEDVSLKEESSFNAVSISESRSSILEIDSVSKRFGGLRVINDLTLSVNRGEIVGIIGPNGAGKTTLFNLITGFYQPNAGKITFEGNDITSLKPPHKISRLGIARTFQIVKPLEALTVLDNVAAGAAQRSRNYREARDKSLHIICSVGLEKYKDVKATSLTLPARKRLELARALATEPKLLLLDEVMAGLNPTEIDEAIRLIKMITDSGVTLLVIEHLMKAIMKLADRVVVIDHGQRIFIGPPQEARKDDKVISAYLGKDYAI